MEIAVYSEVEDDDLIVETLRDEVGLSNLSNTLDAPLLDAQSKSRFEPFATYSTTRVKYSLADLSIDVDEASYGYGVVEIECMCKGEKDISEGETR